MKLKDAISLWLEGVYAGVNGICGFDHDVFIEPTNGKWEPGESFRITFRHEGGCWDGEGRVILSAIVSRFRDIFNGKVGEYATKTEDDGWSAVVEDVRGPRGL